MYYYSPSVKQCKDRKGKPWRATVYYKDPLTNDRKQKTKMLPTAKGKKEAEQLARLWMDELNNVAPELPPAQKHLTVDEMIKQYEEYRLNTGEIEKSTYKRDLLITKNYIKPYLGDYLFTAVERTDIAKWITDLYNKKGLSQTTVRNAYAQLKKVYTYYCEIDELDKNPFKGVKAPKEGKPRISHLSKEQSDAFIDAVYNNYKPTDAMYCGLLLAYYAGLRRGEICGLRWRNIDFDKGTITIDSAIGYGAGGNYTKPPKTESSNRTFPLMPQLKEALKARYDYIKPHNSWFVIGKEDKFMSLQSFTNNFQKFADDNELKDNYGKRLTPHSLRHNVATVGINSGMDIASLSLMMGHASRAMTLDTYGDANPDALRTAIDKLGLKFSDDSSIGDSDEVAEELYEIEQRLDKNK